MSLEGGMEALTGVFHHTFRHPELGYHVHPVYGYGEWRLPLHSGS